MSCPQRLAWLASWKCSDPIELDLVIRVVIYCPDIFMPRNACAYTVQD